MEVTTVATTLGRWYTHHMRPTVENVINEYLRASDNAIAEGMEWYNDAHQFARTIGGRHFHRAAGVIAALSPMNVWSNNKRKAALLYAQDGNVEFAPDNSNGIGLRRNVEKAIAIYNGEDAFDVLGGDKVRSFFLTILDPSGDYPPVIDRHAFDIAIGRRTNDDAKGVLKRKGEYERFADTYRDGARLIGCSPSQLQAITWVSWRERHGIFW